MRIHRIFICVVGIIAFVNLFACSTTTNKVTPLAEMPDKSNPGAIYILPKTAVALKFSMKITTSKIDAKRDCKKIIEDLLNEKSGSSSVTFENIQLVTESVPDTDHIYNIDLSTTFLQDTKKKLVFNESGMLVSADYANKNKALEFSFQVIESLVKIGTTAFKPGVGSLALVETPQESPCSEKYKRSISTYTMLVTGKDLWLIGSNQAGIDPSLDVFKARAAAIDARIQDVKENLLGQEVTMITITCPIADKFLLASGTIDMLSLFKDDVAKKRIANLIEKVKKKAGQEGLAELESLKVIVKVNDQHPSQMIKGLVAEQRGERGLYYRMPGEVSITLMQTRKEMSDKILSDTFKARIAQLGPVLSLPSKMKTTDAAFSMEFFTDTGGLKSLGVETKAIDMQQVEKLGNSGVALVSAIAASNNKINQLKQQKEELSLEMDIRELREGKRPTQ